MKIAILGTGSIGGTLGRRLATSHDLVFGTRDPGAPAVATLVAECGSRARATSVADAVRHAGVVLVATPAPAVDDVIAACGDLSGRIVVDATNPVGPGLTLAGGFGDASVAERIARSAPGARVVKAFNTAGFNVWADPLFGGIPADLHLAGDDAEAKAVVGALGRELGLEPVDCGPLSNARLLEGLALLWINLAMKGGFGRDITWKLLRR